MNYLLQIFFFLNPLETQNAKEVFQIINLKIDSVFNL